MTDLKLSNQEAKVIAFLTASTANIVHWEELVQFAKDPEMVKLKTIQKLISNLKRKYFLAGSPFPFNGKFKIMDIKQELVDDKKQVLVQVKNTPDGRVVRMDSTDGNKPTAQIDFVLDPLQRRVKTKYGAHLLNEREWEMMKYLHANVGKVIRISEFRDKVVYEKYGSKLPPRWFDSIKTIIGNLRAQVPGLKDRIMTVKGIETGYLFQ